MSDSMKLVLVVVGDQCSFAGDAGGPVVPGPGGHGQQALGDVGEYPGEGPAVVGFEVKLACMEARVRIALPSNGWAFFNRLWSADWSGK